MNHMGLKLYNTLHRKLEDFTPTNKTVKLYSCGLTVQGKPHVGHMRAYIVRDVLVRWLEYLGYDVRVLENFTDIDDKIIEKQQEQGRDWRLIAEDNITEYLDASRRLNIKRASFYPRASQHIEEIIALVKRLIDKGLAYEKGGDVYFKVRKFPGYGKLSNKSIDELMSGARIAPTEHKEDPLDFALWKAAKQGEPYWMSPWGRGRPGWHIECSAMSMHYLGETFDIHMGGEDLIFPHHENEIAQSEAATEKQFARFWLHNGWVLLRGEKMAKSTGHYFLIKDLLKKYSPNVIRLYLLKTQYRTQIEFAEERLAEARAALARLMSFVHEYRDIQKATDPVRLEEFIDAMNDDLNTPRALGIMFELVNQGYEKGSKDIAQSILYYLDLLGFVDEKLEEPFDAVMRILDDVRKKIVQEHKQDILVEIKDEVFKNVTNMKGGEDAFDMIMSMLLGIRNRMRREKNYAFADYIRSRLSELNIQIHDKDPETSTYRLETT
jgi:cysteinyl-tRNA synthetase